VSEKTTKAVAWREYLNGFTYVYLSNFKDKDGNPLELTKEQCETIAQNAARMATALTGYDPNSDPDSATEQ